MDSGAAVQAMTLPPGPADSKVFFVRCELLDADGHVVADNLYWQSQRADDVGPPTNDAAFDSKQVSWADMTALDYLPKTALDVTARYDAGATDKVTIRLHNPNPEIAFFERATPAIPAPTTTSETAASAARWRNARPARWRNSSGKSPAWNMSIRHPKPEQASSSCGSKWAKTWNAALLN